MPIRPAINQLPDAVRAELDRRLVQSAFGGYEALESWLETQGYNISKSSIHRYGQKLGRKLDAIRASTQAAAAIAEAAPDDADLRSSAVISLVQTEIFDVLVTLHEAEDADSESRLKLLARAAHSIADLSRASVTQKKWMTQARDKAHAVADEVTTMARESGMSEALAATWREKILGIAT